MDLDRLRVITSRVLSIVLIEFGNNSLDRYVEDRQSDIEFLKNNIDVCAELDVLEKGYTPITLREIYKKLIKYLEKETYREDREEMGIPASHLYFKMKELCERNV